MVRKIIGIRDQLVLVHDSQPKLGRLIRQFYIKLIGDYPRISWKHLKFSSDARLKAKFTMWLNIHGRLLIEDRLIK